MKSTIH